MTGEYRVVVRIESAAADAAEATRLPPRPVVPAALDHAGRERQTLIADPRRAGLDGYAADGSRSVRALQSDSPARAEHRGTIISAAGGEIGRFAAPTKFHGLIGDAESLAQRARAFLPESGVAGSAASTVQSAAVKEAAAAANEAVRATMGKMTLALTAVEGGIGLAASGALQNVAAGITGFLAPNYNPNQAAVSGSGLAALARGMLSDVSLGTGIVTDFLSNLVGSATSADEAAKVFGGELRRSDAGDASRSFADLKQQLAARHKNMEEGLAAVNHGRRLGGAAGSYRGNW